MLAEVRHDPDAFRVVYDRYAERITRFFIQRTADRGKSLDLTAETFSRAWFAVGGFRDMAGGSAGPWLFGIARNVLYASVAKGRLETEAMERLGLLRDQEAQAATEPAWLDGLDEALAALSADQRDAVALRVLGDLSYDEAATALGCSPGAARIRVSRALSTLRNALEGGTR
ncbi:MAG TPA: RNA polymerase sigma factor [Microbacteriaceae bacterium]|nr:RNA polymerase sigma factor [Microbacteriaceae bacterium]